MKIIIKTKSLEITDALEDFIQKKLSGIKKLVDALQESSTLFFEVKRETSHHRKGDIFLAEAIIGLPRKKLVARAHGEDLKALIIEVREELKREIRKHKTKSVDMPRRKMRKAERESL